MKSHNVYKVGVERIAAVADSNGLAVLKHRQPDFGELICYKAITVENETSANSEFRIGIQTNNAFVLRVCYKSVALDTPQTYDNAEIDVDNQNVLAIRISGATAGDLIVAYLFYEVYILATKD